RHLEAALPALGRYAETASAMGFKVSSASRIRTYNPPVNRRVLSTTAVRQKDCNSRHFTTSNALCKVVHLVRGTTWIGGITASCAVDCGNHWWDALVMSAVSASVQGVRHETAEGPRPKVSLLELYRRKNPGAV